MLKKLLKYDLKYIFKLLVIFYILSMLFGILTRVFFSFHNSLVLRIIGEITQGAAISMMCSTLINNILRMWVRFKTNFYGDESYLTHTLPIEKRTHYLSKILTTVITLFVSFAVICLVLFTAYYSKENLNFIKNMLFPLAEAYDSTILGIVALLVFVLFLEFLSAVQCGFSGIILGHKMYRGKIGFSVLYGFIVYSITQVFAVLTVFVVGLFNDDMMLLFTSNQLNSLSVIKTAMTVAIVTYFAISVIVYFVNQKLLKNGVNVD